MNKEQAIKYFKDEKLKTITYVSFYNKKKEKEIEISLMNLKSNLISNFIKVLESLE